MKTLTLTTEEEIALLKKYSITPNELTFIRTLLILQDEATETSNNEILFQQYLESLYSNGIRAGVILNSLQSKGLILKSYKIGTSGSFDPYDIPINKPFIKSLYKSSFELGKDLYNNYPISTTINGCIVALRNVAKHFNSLEDCYRRYGKAIGWSEEKHNYIIDLFKWAKEYDMLKQSLSSFVVNNAWNDLEAIKNGDKSNINFDAIKLV